MYDIKKEAYIILMGHHVVFEEKKTFIIAEKKIWPYNF